MPTVKTAHCSNCRRPMAYAKPHRTPPGYVSHIAKDMCGTCYKIGRRPPVVRGTRGNQGGRSDYIDDIAVERTLAGFDVPLNTVERTEVVRLMTTRLRLSAAEIARRTRMSQRTVTRHRSRIRAAQLELQVAA